MMHRLPLLLTRWPDTAHRLRDDELVHVEQLGQPLLRQVRLTRTRNARHEVGAAHVTQSRGGRTCARGEVRVTLALGSNLFRKFAQYLTSLWSGTRIFVFRSRCRGGSEQKNASRGLWPRNRRVGSGVTVQSCVECDWECHGGCRQQLASTARFNGHPRLEPAVSPFEAARLEVGHDVAVPVHRHELHRLEDTGDGAPAGTRERLEIRTNAHAHGRSSQELARCSISILASMKIVKGEETRSGEMSNGTRSTQMNETAVLIQA
eukprot:1095225-Pleurochrysis_carterae.AAC.1